jgi:hypothetical protein
MGVYANVHDAFPNSEWEPTYDSSARLTNAKDLDRSEPLGVPHRGAYATPLAGEATLDRYDATLSDTVIRIRVLGSPQTTAGMPGYQSDITGLLPFIGIMAGAQVGDTVTLTDVAAWSVGDCRRVYASLVTGYYSPVSPVLKLPAACNATTLLAGNVGAMGSNVSISVAQRNPTGGYVIQPPQGAQEAPLPRTVLF